MRVTLTKGIQDNSANSEEMLSQAVEMRCIRREEQPEDLVGACQFLASEAAGFITGQIVTVSRTMSGDVDTSRFPSRVDGWDKWFVDTSRITRFQPMPRAW